eukprot:SAG22_NODE_3719_length_1560_cov_1.715264_1_plen_68_part_10
MSGVGCVRFMPGDCEFFLRLYVGRTGHPSAILVVCCGVQVSTGAAWSPTAHMGGAVDGSRQLFANNTA